MYNNLKKIMANFKEFNLSSKMVDALQKQGYLSPSLIQQKVIPQVLRGNNVIAQSETGSGKTHAFLIPIIEKIDLSSNQIQALIITPTRELAKQTYDFAKRFLTFYPSLRISLYQGGEDREKQLSKNAYMMPHIAIGTPGRLADVLLESGSLAKVRTLVFDEADMLLDLGYFNDIDRLVGVTGRPQILVFSATLKNNLKYRLAKYIGQNEEIISDATQTASSVAHYAIDIKQQDINAATEEFLKAKNPFSLIIFASRRETVTSLYNYLRKENYSAGILHGDLSQRERKTMIRRFRSGEFQILVSSDIGARGIDIDDVSDILNVDLPFDCDYYFHRAGRTGRFGKAGNCYSFYSIQSPQRIFKLVDLGVNFHYLCFVDGQLSEGKSPVRSFSPKKKANYELEKEIKKAKGFATSKKVKPGYKRKVRLAIEKVKSKHRREVIRKDIRRQRVERYKKEGRSYGE